MEQGSQEGVIGLQEDGTAVFQDPQWPELSVSDSTMIMSLVYSL